MRAIVLTAVVWAAAVMPASAATVKAHASCDKSLCYGYAEFTAAPGEVNALTVTPDGASVTFIDAVPIHPGKSCTAIPGGARCVMPSSAPLSGLTVKLADGDDVATLGVSAAVYGGAGNDRITGSGFLSGGPGTDELIATASTAFRDDDGAGRARDLYVGSTAGADAVSYEGRKTDVDIDLRRSENAGDVFTSIESATGGDGDDRLIGTGGPNRLAGGPGNDQLTGLGGDDHLDGDGTSSALRAPPVQYDRVVGGAGDDSLSGELVIGGAGDDSLSSSNRVECGAGNDEAWLNSGAFVRGDCEELESVGNVSGLKLHAHSDRTFLTNPECYCRYAHYVAIAGAVVVARASMRHESVGYRHWPLALRLNAQGRRLLAARGRLRITVRIYERYEIGYGVSHERFRTELVQPM